MGRRKSSYGREETPPLHHRRRGKCEATGKLRYETRRDAREAGKRLRPEGGVSAYRCEAEEYNTHWHWGRLEPGVKQGKFGRGEIHKMPRCERHNGMVIWPTEEEALESGQRHHPEIIWKTHPCGAGFHVWAKHGMKRQTRQLGSANANE